MKLHSKNTNNDGINSNKEGTRHISDVLLG